MTADIKTTLIENAKAACQKSYAPYSRFHVGSAVLTEAGHIYQGCNVENVSYGLAICAERNAISQAVAAEGENMRLKAVAVATRHDEECTPCGACRQVIAEFGAEVMILHKTAVGEWGESSIKSMLPSSFQMA